MSRIFVFGHRNPDTDSIVSAMAYASLRNALGDREFTPARLGEVSDETRGVLERFGFEAPMRLYNVRTQIQDLQYDEPPVISKAVTVSHAWSLVREGGAGLALPVVHEDGTLYGMLSPSDIAAYDMHSIADTRVEGIPLFNLLSALDGQLIGDGAGVDRVSGEVIVALPQTPPLEERISENSLLICGNQPDFVREAIKRHAACVILCATSVEDEFRAPSDTLIITTPYDAYRAARMVFQAISVEHVCQTENLVSFHTYDYVDDVRESMLESRYRSYPVLDEEERVVGTVSRFHLIRPKRKRVVLVDHNETSQSVPGLDQAEILEIIDHHRLADVQTGSPIYFRNEPVGSTATIIAGIFQEKGIMPEKKMAGLLTAAIVSDTIIFKSPTCTERDIRMAERMARIADVDLNELGHSIFSSASSDERRAEEMLLSDFKAFQIAGHHLGIGQLITTDSERMMARKDEFLEAMAEEKKKRGFDLIMMMLTDVLKEGTQLLFLGDAETIRQAFNVKTEGNAVFLNEVMSRKKQVVPMLSVMWG